MFLSFKPWIINHHLDMIYYTYYNQNFKAFSAWNSLTSRKGFFCGGVGEGWGLTILFDPRH